jgi:hypothetical protein
MLLEAFLRHFQEQPAERYRTLGASSAGSCARRLAYAMFPERYMSEPMTPRRRARLFAGREFERLCLGVVQKMLPAHAAGETAFLWPIPVDADTLLMAMDKIREDRLSGHVLPNMNPNLIPRWRAACVDKGMSRLGGIVIDPVASTVYIPALSDGIVDASEHYQGNLGMSTVEFKTIATAGFRKSLSGTIDYSYRVQSAVQVDAANLDTHTLIFYRLETSHAIEVIYSKKAQGIRATFHLSNGSRLEKAAPIQEPAEEWDEAQIHHPFEPHLLQQARERLQRVLRSTIDDLPEREYGPSFVCRECDGQGIVKCAYCDAEGIAKRSKFKKTKPGEPKIAKEGVPCKRSNGAPMLPCDCDKGVLAVAELGFPCAWCPFLASCYPFAKMAIPDKAFSRPKVLIDRAQYEASGMTFRRPE